MHHRPHGGLAQLLLPTQLTTAELGEATMAGFGATHQPLGG